MSLLTRVVGCMAAASVPMLACGPGGLVLSEAPPGAIDGGGDGGLEAGVGQGVGDPCDDTNRCRQGLACVSGKCEPGRSSDEGTPCTISAECKQGLYCGPARTCAPAGDGKDGAQCLSDGDCISGLRCNVVGLEAKCQPEGTGDVGDVCKLSADCFGGLACAGGMCTPLPPGTPPLGVPWNGVVCNDASGPVTAYFRVPRGTGDGDFFRLPFPNDVRRGSNGHPTLNGFPTPGGDLLGYDVVDRYVKDVEQNADGFSAYPTVTMRWSGSVDFDSLKAAGVVRYVDITPGLPPEDLGFAWSATGGRNAYVCNNSIGIRPPQGWPLTPTHTYAVFVTNGAKANGGGAITRASDLSALLGSTTPADAALAAAYGKYKPLRDWAAASAFDLGSIQNATVFTVAQATNAAQNVAAGVAAAPVPTASAWVKCGSAPSPCPDATGNRACGAANATFDELHALVSLPIFQKGAAPYIDPKDGGDIAFGPSGPAVVQRTEQVCMALTIPKNVTMPAGGWPLVVYAHGTGGTFRSHVQSIAASFTNLDDGAGGTLPVAILGIDQVSHGPRRGGSTQPPEQLFFNFQNPLAARGNPLQGAADQIALVRFARALDLPAASSPTGEDLRFGPIAFWGHSQGATEGAIAMPYTPDVGGVVLSGSGASIIDALLTKTSPVNIASIVPLVLGEKSAIGATHPALSLLQNAIDPADPLNHARALASAPATSFEKHAFVPFGQKDTYTPTAVQSTYVIAARLGVATPDTSVTTPDPIGGSAVTAVPASANLGGGTRTGFTRQYAPSGYDGHFVATQNDIARADVAHFLGGVLQGGVPNVGR